MNILGRGCVQAVELALKDIPGAKSKLAAAHNAGIHGYQIDMQGQSVIVEASVPSLQVKVWRVCSIYFIVNRIKAALETTGKTVAIKGQSGLGGGYD